jgi:hypothetical protein
MTEGIKAAPRIVRLSVIQARGASSPNKRELVLGKLPTTMANRDAIMGGCNMC